MPLPAAAGGWARLAEDDASYQRGAWQVGVEAGRCGRPGLLSAGCRLLGCRGSSVSARGQGRAVAACLGQTPPTCQGGGLLPLGPPTIKGGGRAVQPRLGPPGWGGGLDLAGLARLVRRRLCGPPSSG